jgi:hypothetical protein
VAGGTKVYKPADVEAQLLGVDAKLNLPYVQLLAMYYGGQNLDTYATTAAGVRQSQVTDLTFTGTGAAPKVTTGVDSVQTHGWFGQAGVTPVKGLMLVGGYGEETPDRDTYTKAGTTRTATAAAPQITRNAQISGGAILNLTNRWRVGLEYTTYQTTYFYGTAAPQMYKTFESSQVELGTLYAF